LTAGQARGQHRAAYWDGRYRSWWADDAITIAIRDEFKAAGYTILDADELKTWMDARIADGATSVVVFCRDNAPDTVVESMSANCTLRGYLDAGGKIVWYSDVPLWDLAHSDGTFTYLGGAGCANILGIVGVDWTNSTGSQVTLTDDGIDWGLTETWRSERWTPANQVDIILASDRAGNAAAWVKHFVPGTTYYWRIDEVNDTEPNSPWKGPVWSFSIPSKKAYSPTPADGGKFIDTEVTVLSWTPGFGAVLHTVYFDDDFNTVANATGELAQVVTNFNPGQL